MTVVSTETLLLSEVQFTKVDQTLLLQGYLRKLTQNKCPNSVILLCIKYAKIKDITPQFDDVNFITINDTIKSNFYKNLGNNLFKLKNYYYSITYYSKSLQYDPNNHLVLCNISLCYYNLKQYNNALSFAKLSIESDPVFCKGWYRYGSILEKLNKYGEAGVAYRTAYNISIDWKSRNTTNNYSKTYNRFLKKVNNLKNNKSVISYMNNFEKNVSKNNKNPQEKLLNSLMNLMGSKTKNEMFENFNLNDIMNKLQKNNSLNKEEENERIYNLIQESKYNYYINNNKLQFYGSNENSSWSMSWSTTPVIVYNKRVYSLVVGGYGGIISQYTCYGLPSVDRYIQFLKRCMAYCKNIGLSGKKPNYLAIDYRTINRGYYETIEKHIKPLGIKCVKEEYQQSKQVSIDNNTNVFGWNHLDY